MLWEPKCIYTNVHYVFKTDNLLESLSFWIATRMSSTWCLKRKNYSCKLTTIIVIYIKVMSTVNIIAYVSTITTTKACVFIYQEFVIYNIWQKCLLETKMQNVNHLFVGVERLLLIAIIDTITIAITTIPPTEPPTAGPMSSDWITETRHSMYLSNCEHKLHLMSDWVA